MSFWSNLKAAWDVTSEGSRALTAARRAYDRGEPLTKVVAAWAANTDTPLDDKVVIELGRYLGVAVDSLQRLALIFVQVGIRLEMQAPVLIGRFVAGVAWVDRTVPPLLARLRAAADRAERSAALVRAHA
ncbi:hypothetical protein K2Z84_05425, partial [Candidatus Binatia bacterium]|nr:hypothetical protein [Candidatus Binatia bacterium]